MGQVGSRGMLVLTGHQCFFPIIRCCAIFVDCKKSFCILKLYVALSSIVDVLHLLAWLLCSETYGSYQARFWWRQIIFYRWLVPYRRPDCTPGYDLKNFQLLTFLAVSPADEEPFDLSMFSGTLKRGDVDTGRNCWSIPSGHLFRVRSKRFLVDRSKVISVHLNGIFRANLDL